MIYVNSELKLKVKEPEALFIAVTFCQQCMA